MNPEENQNQNETLRKIAVDMLTRIDQGATMTSDGIARDMMDLVANYGYRSYDKVAKRVLQCFNANPDYYCGDHPLRYTNLSQMWREHYPHAYEAHQEQLRAKREAKERAESDEKSVINQLMKDMAQDLVNRDASPLMGFEPTDGEGQ